MASSLKVGERASLTIIRAEGDRFLFRARKARGGLLFASNLAAKEEGDVDPRQLGGVYG